MLYIIRDIGYYRDGGTIELKIIDGRYYCIHKDTKKIYKGKVEGGGGYVTDKNELENIIKALETYKEELLFEYNNLGYTINKVIAANL